MGAVRELWDGVEASAKGYAGYGRRTYMRESVLELLCCPVHPGRGLRNLND